MELTLQLVYIVWTVCFIIGMAIGYLLPKNLVSTEKKVSLALLIIFASIGILAFFIDKELPWWMQASIIGLMTTSLGIDMASIIGVSEKAKKIRDAIIK